MSHVTQAGIEADDGLRELCELAAAALGCDRVVIRRVSASGGELVPVAVSGGARNDGSLDLSLDREFARDTSVTAFRAAQPIVQNATVGSEPEVDLLGLNTDSVLVAAWPIRQEPIGVLSGYWAHVPALTRQQVGLLDRLSLIAGGMLQERAAVEPKWASDQEDEHRRMRRAVSLQGRLIELLARSQRNVRDKVAELLANSLECAIVITSDAGDVVASAGRPSTVEQVRTTISVSDGVGSGGDVTVVEIPSAPAGGRDLGQGAIYASGRLENGSIEFGLLESSALALAAYGAWTSDKHLVSWAVAPLTLLAIVQESVRGPRVDLAYGTLGVDHRAQLQLAVLDCVTPEHAYRTSARARDVEAGGVEVITAVAEAEQVMLLVRRAPGAALIRAIENALPGVRAVGVSVAGQGLEKLSTRRDEARRALAVAKELGRSMCFSELGRSVDLLRRLPKGEASDFIDSVLMPLHTTIGVGEHRMLDIAEAIAEAEGDLAAAAVRLGSGESELAAERDRIRELTGIDLTSPQDRSLFWLAHSWDQLARGL